MAAPRTCIHNPNCICDEPSCNTRCGWNPKGIKIRQDMISKGNLRQREDGTKGLSVKRGGH